MASSARTDLEQRERLVAKYRAIRAQRVHRNDPNEIIDRVAEEVFGTDEGFEVLIDYLREHGDPRLFEDEEAPAGNGALPDGR